MRFKTTLCILLPFLLITPKSASARAQDQPVDAARERQRLARLAESRDVEGIESAGVEYERAWQAGDRDHYAALMGALINSAKNLNLNPRVGERIDRRVSGRLVYQFAFQALQHRELSLEHRTRFAFHLMSRLDDPAMHSSDRHKSLDLLFEIWDEQAAMIDPRFDSRDLPARPIAPTEIRSGASPEGITDPVVREQYAQALAEYERTVEHYMKQAAARELYPLFDRSMEKCLVRVYSARPDEIADLRARLARHFQNADAETASSQQERILSMVQTAIAATCPATAPSGP